MRETLIAIATAGVLASGAAVGETTNWAEQRFVTPMISPVQHAQPSNYRWDDRSLSVNEREARIRDRIERGHGDGRITDREARRLLRQLAEVEGKERAFLADGRLNRRENAELNRDLDRVASNVRVELRDEQRRY